MGETEEGIEARGIKAPSCEAGAKSWACPRCGYSLHGLVKGSEATCPECGRVTSEAEMAELARRREMPRNLARIAQFGLVFTLVLWGWSILGLLVTLWTGPRRPGTGNARTFAAALILCSLAIALSCCVYRRLQWIHQRSEAWAWIAAHATWVGVLGSVAILRTG